MPRRSNCCENPSCGKTASWTCPDCNAQICSAHKGEHDCSMLENQRMLNANLANDPFLANVLDKLFVNYDEERTAEWLLFVAQGMDFCPAEIFAKSMKAYDPAEHR